MEGGNIAHRLGRLTVAFTPCPAAFDAVMVVLRHRGAWVLVRNPRRAWEFPGGRRLAGETWAETARREAAEEAGARLRDLRYVGWYARPGGGATIIGAAEVAAFTPLTGAFETTAVRLFPRLPADLSFRDGLYDFLTASDAAPRAGPTRPE